MKQIEFEEKLVAMKNERQGALLPLQQMVRDLQVSMSNKSQAIYELQSSYSALKQQCVAMRRRIAQVNEEHNKRIREFAEENRSTERTLENVGLWTIVKELRRRGWRGTLYNLDESIDATTINEILSDERQEGDEQDE